MKILLIPQVRDFDKIWYEIEDQKITATINDISDIFDFADMPDGELQVYDSDGESMIETTLEEVPIRGAEKTDGVLTVKILFSINADEEDERLLFPKPMSLVEFNDLMAELVERVKVGDDIIDEDERVDGEEPVRKNDNVIDLEEVDF